MKTEVMKQSFEVVRFKRPFDVRALHVPLQRDIESAIKSLGIDLKISAGNDGTLRMSAHDLSWETEIETPEGAFSLRELVDSEAYKRDGKVRCQSPFRDSDSWAAFVSRGGDGQPFVYDTGTCTTHWLSEASRRQIAVTGDAGLFELDRFRASRFVGKTPQPMEWLVNDLLPAGVVGLIVAPGGTGKSWFLFQLAMSVVSGIPLAGKWSIPSSDRPRRVLMLSAEDDERQLHLRWQRAIEHVFPDADTSKQQALADQLYLVPRVGEDNLLTSVDSSSREVGMTALLDRLITSVTNTPDLSLIIIDPASRFRGGDENAAQDATRFVEALERIAKATRATVLLAHHSNKGAHSADEANQNASRGSSALTDGVRWQMNLMTFSVKDAKKHGIPESDRTFYVTATLTKSNYSPPQPPVVLKRLDGGYLHDADLIPAAQSLLGALSARIVALVNDEIKAGRHHSKSAFAERFGGTIGQLAVGDNRVRDALNELLKANQLTLRGRKLALPGTPELPRRRVKT